MKHLLILLLISTFAISCSKGNKTDSEDVQSSGDQMTPAGEMTPSTPDPAATPDPAVEAPLKADIDSPALPANKNFDRKVRHKSRKRKIEKRIKKERKVKRSRRHKKSA